MKTECDLFKIFVSMLFARFALKYYLWVLYFLAQYDMTDKTHSWVSNNYTFNT